MRKVERTFWNKDGTRKVEIYRRPDGTFGFEELKYGQEEQSWFPVGMYSFAVVDSLEHAIKEAESRVSWLINEA
jgi:hypothetical protein